MFTDARKLKNNLTKHELVKKLKKDMNRMLLSAKPFIKEVVKGAATAGVHGIGIKIFTKLSPSANAFIKGYEEGVWQAVVSTKDSVVGLVTDPVGTAKSVVTGVWDTVSNPKESFHNLRRDLEGLYYQVKDGSWETRGQLAGNFVMSTISDKGIGKVLKVTPKSQGTPKPKETQQPTQGTGNATHPKESKSPEGTGKPNISQKHDEIAHDGYYGRKQERTNEYNTPIADRNEIVGGNTNGYRLTEPIKWMESMGMIQIKKKIVD